MVTTDELKHLSPLEHIDNGVLNRLLEVADVQLLDKGQCLFEFGSKDDSKIYLLDGALELTAKDGRVRSVSTDQQKPISQAIASLVPRQYTVTAAQNTKIVRFENETFRKIIDGEKESTIQTDIEENNEFDEHSGIEGNIFTQIFIDISGESFELPNLPEVASRSLQLLRDEESDVNQLEEIIQADPSIAAKLLKAANSALYGGQSQVDSISQAIVRIGYDTTTQMVMGFAMGNLFVSDNKLIKQLMHNLWYHSVYVASIATVMSKKLKKFDTGQALLAGLIHDIGKVAVLSYIDKNNFQPSVEEIDTILSRLRGDIGSMILTKWNFSDTFIGVVEGVEDWMRDHEPEADLCDLIMISQLHANIQNPTIFDVPAMFELPAFQKLGLDLWQPETGLALLEEAKQDVQDTMSMFKA